MKAKRWMAACVAVLLSIVVVQAKEIRVAVFKVSQMTCENCERKVQNNMRFEKGLKALATEVKTKTVTISYDAEKTNVKRLQEGFRKFNYEAELLTDSKLEKKSKK